MPQRLVLMMNALIIWWTLDIGRPTKLALFPLMATHIAFAVEVTKTKVIGNQVGAMFPRMTIAILAYTALKCLVLCEPPLPRLTLSSNQASLLDLDLVIG